MRTQAVNSTAAVTYIHPCYEIDDSNDVVTYNPSVFCTFFYIIIVLFSVITVCGNLLVAISVIYFKQLHTPTNYLILSLAIADLLVGVVVLPLCMVFSYSSCMYHGHLFCTMRGWFDTLLSYCSILNLCCISIERYYAVCQPLLYRVKISRRVVVRMIVVSWLVSAFIVIAHIVGRFANEDCGEHCFTDVIITNTLGAILSFYLPVTIMLCIYLKIYLVARKLAGNMLILKSGGAISKSERKATKTLSIVLGVFLLCWTPYFLCITFLPLNKAPVPIYIIEALNFLTLSNSMFNPFIYAFFYSWFRTAIRMIITGRIFQRDCANFKLN